MLSNRFSLWEIKRRVVDATGAADGGLDVKFVSARPATYGVWPPSFALSPDRRHFAFVDSTGSTSPKNNLNLWPLDARASPRHISTNLSFTFTPDGRQLVTIGRECEVVAVDVETAATVSPAFSVVLPNSPPEDPQGRRIALSPDGMKLAISSADRLRVDIWNWRTRRHLYSLPDQEGMITDAPVWSPDSHHLAARYFDGSTVVWNIEAVEQLLAELGLRL
jgi:WD40 repeat protein